MNIINFMIKKTIKNQYFSLELCFSLSLIIYFAPNILVLSKLAINLSR